jgi:hypothetical protein
MNAFRTNWPLAMSAALTLTLISGVADARGGGHAGAVAHPMAPASHVATTPSPEVGLPGGHSVSGLPGGIELQPHPIGAMRSPAATTVTSPAMASWPQATHSAAGAPKAKGRSTAAAAAAALAFSGIDTSPPPPPPDRVTPPSAIAAPEPELAPIAPLSPQLPTQFATGGVTQPNLALSPSASSAASPSESAPSTPGGGGKSLADCMGFWDHETHMSKAEWKAACVRTMQDYPTVLR